MNARLSKSRYTAGLRCPKLLWWTVHEPDAVELVPPLDVRARMAWGARVGKAAWQAFPGGVAIARERGRSAAALEATRAAIADGAERIYEAAFAHRDVFVAVDILERGRRGWTLREVKSTTQVKENHLPDATIQTWVLQGEGLAVDRIEVLHLNRGCVYPDLSNLFAGEDVSQGVGALLPRVDDEVEWQLALLKGPLPNAPTGEHCNVPYVCPFKSRCWPERPLDHVSRLYYGGRRRRELLAAGIERIQDIPPDVELNEVQDRQRRAVCASTVVVDEGLGEAMEDYEAPIAYLDFETVSLPIPAWSGCRPYDAVPVQFASAVRAPDGSLSFAEHLADAGGDPRPALARALVRALADAGTILAWNAPFEKGCIEHLMSEVPDEAEGLERIWDALADLLPVVRNHVYAPAFGGSFSLKAVLPALVSEMAYDDLEVAGGLVASTALERLLLEPASFSPEERETLRADLVAYCRRDVEGLAAVHGWLEARA